MEPATNSDADIIDRLEQALEPETAEIEPQEQPEIEEPEAVVEDAEATQGDEVEEVIEEVEDDGYSVDRLFGVDESRIREQDGELYVETIVDGAKEWVKSSELLKDYQTQKHTTQKSMELAEQRKEFEAQQQQVQQAIAQKYQQAEQYFKTGEQLLLAEYQGIDWQQLERDDPTSYMLQRQKFSERAALIQQAQEAVTKEQQAAMQQQQAQMQEQHAAFLKDEMAKAVSDYPAWQDAAVMERDISDIKAGMLSYGYSEEDFAGVVDHRQVAILRDALAYRAGKKHVAEKKAKPVPKFQQPGRKRDANASAQKAKKAKMARLKRSGSPKDGIDILMDII